MKRIYCDGVFDLFHNGHLLHLQKIVHYFNEPIYLLVGVISDNVSKTYKRQPIFNEQQRLKTLDACIYVNEAFITDTLIIDEEYMTKYNIDFVIHAFNDTSDKSKQNDFFEIPMKLNKFIEIDYNANISTTQIIKENNLYSRSNYIDIDVSVSNINHIINVLQIPDNSEILEIGCLFPNYFSNHSYIGTNIDMSFVAKQINKFGKIVLQFDVIKQQILKTKYFDYTLISFHNEDAHILKIIEETERMTKYGIYFININKESIEETFFINKGFHILNQNSLDFYDAYKII